MSGKHNCCCDSPSNCVDDCSCEHNRRLKFTLAPRSVVRGILAATEITDSNIQADLLDPRCVLATCLDFDETLCPWDESITFYLAYDNSLCIWSWNCAGDPRCTDVFQIRRIFMQKVAGLWRLQMYLTVSLPFGDTTETRTYVATYIECRPDYSLFPGNGTVGQPCEGAGQPRNILGQCEECCYQTGGPPLYVEDILCPCKDADGDQLLADGCTGWFRPVTIVNIASVINEDIAPYRYFNCTGVAIRFSDPVVLVGLWPSIYIECVDADEQTTDDCETPPNGCAYECISFTLQTISNGTCTDCNDFNGTHILYQLGLCTWKSNRDISGHCLGEYPTAAYGEWVATFDDVTRDWEVAYIVYDAGDTPLGTVVTYEMPSWFGGPITFTYVSDSGDCTGWPATLPRGGVCAGEPIGACCETVSSTGFSPCTNTTEDACNDLGGNFLGVGTRCGEEGCGGCDYPGSCSTFPSSYDFVVSGVTGTCAAQINGTVTLTGGGFSSGGSCVWTGSNATWSNITLTVDSSVTPATFTLTGVGQSPCETTTAELSGTGRCCDELVDLAVDSFVEGTCCGGTSVAGATARLVADALVVACAE